jgi:hypothetical protein
MSPETQLVELLQIENPVIVTAVANYEQRTSGFVG